MTYLFLDLETTGLDPKEDFILEMAWAVTDDQFEITVPPKSFIRRFVDAEDVDGAQERLRNNEFVYQMHHRSGLLDDISAHSSPRTLAWMYEEMLVDLVYTLDSGEDEEVPPRYLAGNSIHFDKTFLLENGFGPFWKPVDSRPKPLLSHRMLDISAIKLLFGSAGVGYPKAPNALAHRAVNDVLESIEQARIFKEIVQLGWKKADNAGPREYTTFKDND